MRLHSKPLLVVLALSVLVLGAAPPPAKPKPERTDMEKQQQTVNEMRNIGVSLSSWLTDQVSASAAGAQEDGRSIGLESYSAISSRELEKLLVPVYITRLPKTDGWGNPYEFRLNLRNKPGRYAMMVRSPGRNGKYSAGAYSVHRFNPENYDEDIVWADGIFIRWPQRQSSDLESQLETVTNMYYIGTAMSAWLVDQVGAESVGMREPSKTIQIGPYRVISAKELKKLLVPQYIGQLPERDGWGRPYEFRLNVKDVLGQRVMMIRSPGHDGSYSAGPYSVHDFNPGNYGEDIVWADGSFVRRPQGPDTTPPQRKVAVASRAQTSPPGAGMTDMEKQRKTSDDIRNTGTALFSWFTDQDGTIVLGARKDRKAVDLAPYHVITSKELETLLVPQYLRRLPKTDGWGNPYEYRLNRRDLKGPSVMMIRSPGRDGRYSAGSYRIQDFSPQAYDEDIVWADGSFVRGPQKDR